MTNETKRPGTCASVGSLAGMTVVSNEMVADSDPSALDRRRW